MHLFVYGSLMFEPVWSRLVWGSYVRQAARLHGFALRRLRRDVYPVVFRSGESDWVDGLVYQDVAAGDIARLDWFEGEFYERQFHPVLVEDGLELPAAVYLLKDDYEHLIDAVEWDPQWFATEGLGTFLGQYRGF